MDNRYFGIDVKLDTSAARTAARRMCEHQDLRVIFDLMPQDAPYTDGRTIHIESPHQYQTKAAMNAWWGKLVHETRHNTTRGRQCFEVAKREKLNMKSLHGFMFNVFEDCVVDNIDRGRYVGQDEASSWFHSFLFDKHTLKPDNLKEVWYNKNLPKEGLIVATGFLLDGLTRADYMPDMVGKVAQFLDTDTKIAPEIRDKIEELLEGDWLDRLKALAKGADDKDSKAEDVWQFTKDFLEDEFEQPPYEPPPESGEGDGGEGYEDGESEAGQEAAEGKDGKDKAKAKYCQKIFEEFARDDHAAIDVRYNSTSKGTDMDLIYEKGSSMYTPLPDDNKVIVDYEARSFFTAGGEPATIGTNFERYAYSIIDGADLDWVQMDQLRDSLAHEVKRYIQSETRKKQTRNKKKGMLDKKKLFKLGVPDAGKDWQERVFWTLDNKFTVDNTVVSLLCDISGSMSGDKIVHAIHSMDMLGDVCRTLKINHEMAAFTTISFNGAAHFLYKPFNVRVPRTEIVNRMVASTDCMASNADGESIKIAYNRLKNQEAKRRVLIVLSDGYPAFGGGDISWYTKAVTEQIQEEGIVDLHGIGIRSDAVKEFYSSYSVLENSEQLEECLLTVLKNKVLRFN